MPVGGDCQCSPQRMLGQRQANRAGAQGSSDGQGADCAGANRHSSMVAMFGAEVWDIPLGTVPVEQVCQLAARRRSSVQNHNVTSPLIVAGAAVFTYAYYPHSIPPRNHQIVPVELTAQGTVWLLASTNTVRAATLPTRDNKKRRLQ